MATILNFVPRPRRVLPGAVGRGRRTATVIIFPGVRYEKRHEPVLGGDDDRPRDARRRLTKP